MCRVLQVGAVASTATIHLEHRQPYPQLGFCCVLHPLVLSCAVTAEAAKIVFDAGRQVGRFLWHHARDEASVSDSMPAHA